MDTPETALERLRAEIDAVDQHIADLLVARSGIVARVATLKSEHWPRDCHIRPGREGRMHRRVAERFAGSGFPVSEALGLWRQMIGGSAQMEAPLTACYLAAHPAHALLAREYFGIGVGLFCAGDLAQALAAIAQGHANLLLIPPFEERFTNDEGQTLYRSGLRVFASLPLVNGQLLEGFTPALALACIDPEPSGDDISYFCTATGEILRETEFAASHKNDPAALFLGAHPAPLTL